MSTSHNKASTAIIGLTCSGHIPTHLRALILSKWDFTFIGASKLFNIAVDGLPETEYKQVQRYFIDSCASAMDEASRVDGILENTPDITRLLFLELDRFRIVVLLAKSKLRFGEIGKRRIAGNLILRNCLYLRENIRDVISFVLWQSWVMLAHVCIERGGLLVIDPKWRIRFPITFLIPYPWLKFRVWPEPYDRILIPTTCDLAPDVNPPAVLFFGHHSRRKGTDWALDKLRIFPQPLRVIVAGQCESTERVNALLAEFPRNVIAESHLERIDDRRKEELFKRATVIALPYEMFVGSSGLIFEALLYRRKVLASDVCDIDHRLIAAGAVRLFSRASSNSFIDELAKSINSPTDWQAVEAFLGEHGIQKFTQSMLIPVKNE